MKRFKPRPALGALPERRPTSRTPKRGGRWHATSVAYRKAHPICNECKKRVATEVHHIKEWADDEAGRYDWANLEALCHECHLGRHGQGHPPGPDS